MLIGITLHVTYILENHNMDRQLYLNNEIPKLVTQNNSKNYFLWNYNKIRIKRFAIHTVVIFIFQFLIIVNLTLEYPTLPMHPPIGVAFVMFYLFGNNAFLGLLLSEFYGYFLHNLPTNIIFSHLFADLFGGWLGSHLCKDVLFFNTNHLTNAHEVLKFIKKNAFITCFISSLTRMLPTVLTDKLNCGSKILLYNYIDLWLADLNAILIIASFILSWTYVLFNQYRISDQKIKQSSIIILITFIIFSMMFMKKIELIYLIIITMMLTVYCAYYYGYLIATFLLFIVSCIYLTYFMAFKNQYLLYFSLPLYTLTSIILLLFTICMLYVNLIRNPILSNHHITPN